MKRRPKLDAGNFPSWEERIDYQLNCAFDHAYRLREADLDLYAKVGGLEGRLDRAATATEVRTLRDTVTWLARIAGGLSALVLALLVFAAWSVLA